MNNFIEFFKKYSIEVIGLIIFGILLGTGGNILVMSFGGEEATLERIVGADPCYADIGNHLLTLIPTYKNADSSTATPPDLWAEVTHVDSAVIVNSITPKVAFPYLPPGSSAPLTFKFVLVDSFVATSTSVILEFSWYEPLYIYPYKRKHTSPKKDTLTCAIQVESIR